MAVEQQVLVDHATHSEEHTASGSTTTTTPRVKSPSALPSSPRGLSSPTPSEMSVFSDATAAEIPEAFITACHGNKKKAKARWEATKKWRAEHKMDTILERPWYKYPAIRKYYGHFLQGYTRDGNILSIDTPANMDCAALRAAGVTPHDMALHTGISFEFMFKTMDTRPNAGVVTIMDLAGLTLRKAVSFDHLAMLRAISEVSETHYPGRIKKILIVNPPRLFHTIFGALKAVLPVSVRDQIEIISDIKDLQKHVAPEWLPPKFGGSGPEIEDGAPEIDISEFLLNVIKKADEEAAAHQDQQQPGTP